MFTTNKINKLFAALLIITFSRFSYAADNNPRETPVVKVVRENAKAVVNISTERIILLRENPFWGRYGNDFDLFFEQFFGGISRQRALKLQSVGSGVILDKSGIIVTNAHVVNMASNIFVVLNDGTQVAGKVMYENPQDDVAIIKIEPPFELTKAELGQTEDIMIGETVVAIGNPLGLENTVTVGVISGKDRKFHTSSGEMVADDLLQIDAPINPGNSGGALLNLNGELVGINVAVVQRSQSIGFAIPVEKVKLALDDYNRNKNFVIKRKTRPFPSTPKVQPQQEDDDAQMRTDEWDPFDRIERMKERMNRIFQDSFSGVPADEDFGMFKTDLFYDKDFKLEETKDGYQIKIDTSNLDENKIDIEIHHNAVTISGQYSQETEETGPSHSMRSQRFGSFLKTIPIPSDADPDGLTTEKMGKELVITIPKR